MYLCNLKSTILVYMIEIVKENLFGCGLHGYFLISQSSIAVCF